MLVALFGTHLDDNGNITDPEKEKISEILKTHRQIYDQMQWQTPVPPFPLPPHGPTRQKKPAMPRNLLIINWNHGLKNMAKFSNTASKFQNAQMMNAVNL